MIVPAGFKTFKEALRAGCEVFHHLKMLLHSRGLSTGVGDEGGFAPVFQGESPHEQAIAAILQAIQDAGYKAGKDIFLALDVAASEFASDKDGPNHSYQFEGQSLDSRQLIQKYIKWIETYPIVSIEDGLAEGDWKGWSLFTREAGTGIQLVGDDLFVTNPQTFKKGIDQKIANAILIKLNQIGTVTETLETMKMAALNKYQAIASHRSGETSDTFVADLAVAVGAEFIKTGSLSRSERVEKYNRLMEIEQELYPEAYPA
jgi:enolase